MFAPHLCQNRNSDHVDLGGPVLSVLYPAGLIAIASVLLLSISIWRSATLPRWAAIAFALHIVLLSFPVTYITEMLGALLLFVAGTGIAWRVWQQETPAEVNIAGRIQA